jgi:hypothetical protein
MYVRVYERLGQPPEERQPDFVRLILIDPTGIFKNYDKLREDFRSKLEDKFNNLDPNWLKQAHIRFRVQYGSNDPSNEEKARFGKLDFPVYLLGRQHGYKTVWDLMTQHKIPKTIKERDYYDIAKECWEQKDTRGCGIPSGEGFRKVGFIKTHRVFEDATGELWQAFVNVTAHEIGHMGNRLQHNKTGLMKYPLPLNVDIDFDSGDKYLFLSDLQRLRRLKEETMMNKPKPKIREFRWIFR